MAAESTPQLNRQSGRHLSGHLSETQADMVSVQEAAQLCQTSERTIARYVRQGRLVSVKQGKRRLICRSSITDIQGAVRQPSSVTFQTTSHSTATEVQESLHDIRQLICTLVELYHPDSLSDVARKHDLQSRIRRICQKRNKDQRHD